MSFSKDIAPEHPDLILSNACNYADMSFWDARYKTQDDDPYFEWYLDYYHLQQTFQDIIPSEHDSILMLGCGNSNVSYDMMKDGYTNIVNMDFSRVVIYQMQHKYPQMKWEQMNALHMSYPDNTFQIVIDKGTLDCIFCNSGVDGIRKQVKAYCDEIERVLQDNGLWIVISQEGPESRLEHFETDDCEDDEFLSFDCVQVLHLKNEWEDTHPVNLNTKEENGYYVYVCAKNPEKFKKKERIVQRAKEKQNALAFQQVSGEKAFSSKHKEQKKHDYDKENNEEFAKVNEI